MKAKKLSGDITIGIFSPSAPASATAPARYHRGAEYLQSKGYNVIHGNLRGKRDFYRSGSIKERADEFNQLLYNEDVQILMSAIGGFNTNSILPYIDYEYLKKHPKVIIGYSDITALHLAVYAKTGLVTFYGPAASASFGEFPPLVDETFESFDAFMRNKISFPYTYEMPKAWTDEYVDWNSQTQAKNVYDNAWICGCLGTCRGRLVGGNLNTMYGIWGTEYMPKIQQGDILLIEDSLKDACTIERSFALLKLSGVFDKVGGIILGKHEKFDDNGSGRQPLDVLLEVMGEPNIPILADFDCCHTHPMLTMPIGCEVLLDATNKCVTLLESPFEE